MQSSDEKAMSTLPELLDYIERHADEIYVRETINGEPGNHRLSELPAPRALHWAFEWIRRGVVPRRVRTGWRFFDDTQAGG